MKGDKEPVNTFIPRVFSPSHELNNASPPSTNSTILSANTAEEQHWEAYVSLPTDSEDQGTTIGAASEWGLHGVLCSARRTPPRRLECLDLRRGELEQVLIRQRRQRRSRAQELPSDAPEVILGC
ncbi:hypothetical protein VE03_07908 [Pseudogymnoascus sp. 23342-1-I1]|nr:hypothetical protein VE03_07908 [Pseudogymnoascus sp. 23342-1-I1]